MSPALVSRLRQSSARLTDGTRGIGSGVIWSAGGLIVTNAHVVQSSDLRVTMWDGREFRADLLQRDQRRDLALLHIGAQDLMPAEIADPESLRVGQWVTALGNPFGVESISGGIIHSLSDRRWIQADVRLAPGNSGGILADAQGRLVGINTMIYHGIALAVPSNVVVDFVRSAGAPVEKRAA